MLPGLGWHDRVLDVLEVVRLDRPVCPCAGRSTLLDDFDLCVSTLAPNCVCSRLKTEAAEATSYKVTARPLADRPPAAPGPHRWHAPRLPTPAPAQPAHAPRAAHPPRLAFECDSRHPFLTEELKFRWEGPNRIPGAALQELVGQLPADGKAGTGRA